jgi:hypothetical protein
MEKKLEMLYGLCEIVTKRLEECWRTLEGTEEMTVLDIDLVDKLTHALKCIKTCIAMIEEEDEDEGGASRRSYAREGSYRGSAYDGGSMRSYDGYSGRRGRSPRTGRYVSREGGYSGREGIEDILMDVREMPESERRKLMAKLEKM